MSWPYWFGVLLIVVAVLTILGEVSVQRKWIPLFTARKAVHITVALCCAMAVFLVPMSASFIGGVAVIVVFLWFTVNMNVFAIDRVRERRSWGIFYFGLSYLILILLFGYESRSTVMLGMAVMGLADAMAALVGKSNPVPSLSLGRETKSWAGSISFLVVSGALLFSFASRYLALDGEVIVALTMLVIWLSVVENASGSGTDNLSVPLLFGWVFYTLFQEEDSGEMLSRFMWVFVPAAAFVYFASRTNALTKAGSVTAASLGVILFTYGSWAYVLPILVFFGLGTILSRLSSSIEQGKIIAKSGPRDSWQVLANGGVPALALIWGIYFDRPEQAYVMYLAALSCTMADTFATEIGMRYGGRPRNILTGKATEVGLSGGVTAAGFGGSLIGAIVIAIIGLSFVPYSPWFWLIIAIGFGGAVLDSILGLVQAKFALGLSDHETLITEQHSYDGHELSLRSGFRWLNNDLVNAISSFAALLSAGLLVGAVL